MTTEMQPAAEPGGPTFEGVATAARPAVPSTVKQTRRRRRPSGAPPPLPRHLGSTGRVWLVTLAVLLVWMVVIYTSAWARRLSDRVDAVVLRQFARLRTDWLTDVATAYDRLWGDWPVFGAATTLIVLIIIFKRWRHLITFVGSVIVYAIVSDILYATLTRPRPYDVTTIGAWGGFSLPSLTVGAACLLVIAVTYSMVTPGRPRTVAKLVSIVAVGALAAARLYLAVDHPFDQLLAVALAVGVMVNAYRFFTPNEVFPVAYGRGKSAHLDVTGRRADAIRNAVQDQLGLTVVDIKPVGLAGSGGSTPLRLRVAGDPDTYLFGKLYAMNHVRADRWYKTGRTILYGRLEDEAPFQSVRRLVQYEDYTLRLMRDAGIPTAAPSGIVELTPEREYLLVTEFFDGAQEIGEAVVDDEVIDNGLAIVRRLWDYGLAHRDIKPANLLVKDGRVMLIDVAFAQVRPSPWREAVDLANMMLVLAVRTDAERVYHRAVRYFTPDEIAEAFAATRGIASPTQLRAAMKQDGRDLVAEFRALAPERRPISLQRWSVRRVVYALGLVGWRRGGGGGDVAGRPARRDGRDRSAHVRHERRDGAHGAGRSRRRLGPLHRGAARRLEARWREHPRRRGKVLAQLGPRRQPRRRRAPAPTRGLRGGWRQCGADRRAGHSTLRGTRAAPAGTSEPALLPLRGRLRHLRLRVQRRRRARRSCSTPTTRSPSSLGCCWWTRFVTAPDSGCAVRALPARADRDERPPVMPSGLVMAASAGEVTLRVVTALGVAIVTTVFALRLLGGRRGWVTALLAGAVGWTVAALLALGVNDWDWGADGLILQMTGIGVTATMAAAVAIDLLSRPGSLARGDRAGLVIAPRPIRAVRQRISVLRRYRELVHLVRDAGFGPMPSAGGRAERSAKATGVRIRRVLEEAGGVYVKLGQIAATRPDLVPPDICAELAGLQNQVTPEPVEGIRPVLEEELGAEVEVVFAEFDWEPLAAGSIGQTYRARLRTGEPVVVKVQRPDIHDVMERDLAALALLAGVAQRRTPFGQGLRSAEMLAQFASSLRAELDFQREAEAMKEMAALTGTVRVPMVYGELCTARLLVQERFNGFTLADTAQLEASDIDRRALGEQLLRSTLEQVLRFGLFHADPHPGNVFAFDDGTLGLIDFGAVGRLDPVQQSAVVDMLAALARRDASLLRDGIERVAEMSESVAPERLERALARLMADHVRANGVVEPTVLQDLVRTLSEFDIRLPADLVLLSRALVTLDGTLRILSPGLSLASAVELMTPSSGAPAVDPQAMVRDELLASLPHLRRLPERIDRLLTLAGRGDLRVRNVVDEDSRRLLRTFVNRGLLAGVGATFVFASTALLVAPDAGPTVASSTRAVRGVRLRRPVRRHGPAASGCRGRRAGRHHMNVEEGGPS